MQKYFLVIFSILFLANCNSNENAHSKPIVMGDTSLIVTEHDSLYLQNFTNDISITSKKISEGSIAKMMTQVDSMQATKKMEEKSMTSISGFTINFNECTVVFDNLFAHALKNDQDERKLNSVTYLKDNGDFLDMNLEIKGLQNIQVEERIITKLMLEKQTELYFLNDLGKFTSPWYNLGGKENRFISVGVNSLQFNATDNIKIKNALDRELRKAKKSREEINTWMQTIAKTNSYTDAPCKIMIVSAQWRIKGLANGKKVQKLVQFDVAH